MLHPNTLRFVEWWRALPRGEHAPARGTVEPADLVRVLPQVFILDERLDFRLAGGLICDLHGRELRDHPMPRLWERADLPRLSAALERAVTAVETVTLHAEARPLRGEGVSLELTVAPLATRAGGSADRLIGLYQPTDFVSRLEGRPVHTLALRRVLPEAAANDGRLRLVVDNGRRIA